MTKPIVPPHVHVSGPWLTVDLGSPHNVAGWPVVGPALGTARTVTWLQVRDCELPREVDPDAYLLRRARADGVPAELGLLTAADVARHAVARHQGAVAVATAGLTNCESVVPSPAAPTDAPFRPGTVNILAVAPGPLTQRGLLEALSIAAEARTAAILGFGLRTADGRPLTGTGTDCVIVASPPGPGGAEHCGLHTGLGRALAGAVHMATAEACARWLDGAG